MVRKYLEVLHYLVQEDDCDDKNLGAEGLHGWKNEREEEIKCKQRGNCPVHEFKA